MFSQASGITTDSNGNVYVGDLTGVSGKIQKFTSNGTFITSWGNLGFGPGAFTNPTQLSADSNDNIYVADLGNAETAVQKFTSNGTFITSGVQQDYLMDSL